MPPLVAGSTMRSKLNFTASALNGVPSWNVTSSRRWKVYVVRSGLTSQLVGQTGVVGRIAWDGPNEAVEHALDHDRGARSRSNGRVK